MVRSKIPTIHSPSVLLVRILFFEKQSARNKEKSFLFAFLENNIHLRLGEHVVFSLFFCCVVGCG